MTVTQAQWAQLMVQQLRTIDPSASAEIGTPERKIIDTVAAALARAEVDQVAATNAINYSAKVGSDLDSYIGQFGFARQGATYATGTVTMSIPSAGTKNILIPYGTQLSISSTAIINAQPIFITTKDAILLAGQTSINIPIRCTTAGVIGNVAANMITVLVSTVTGITAVNNVLPTLGGTDEEGDDALKVRFTNQVFRNVSGTSDQFLAVALAGSSTTKANVIGPISRYREYVQVPAVNDATAGSVNNGFGVQVSVNPTAGTIYNPQTTQTTNIAPTTGSSNQYTTPVSLNPYSKYIYTTVPMFVSNGAMDATARYYQTGIDFTFNTTAGAKNQGDAYRLYQAEVNAGLSPLLAPNPQNSPYQPNLTFTNVYTGTDTTVQAARPSDIVLMEYSYVSAESRNDPTRNITNCVDVYVDGGNQVSDTVTMMPPSNGANRFVGDPSNVFYVENYRRVGEPEHRPVIGNIFQPVFHAPILSLPSSLVVNGATYSLGVHYWAIQEVSNIGGSVTSRDGIEWNPNIPGQLPADGGTPGPGTGPTIIANGGTNVTVTGYTYDKNIVDLQAALQGVKQVTTDVLVHRAVLRYFKLNIAAMYTPGISIAYANQSIANALSAYLSSQTYGSVIQMSTLLQIIHNASGIINVRWARDLDNTQDQVVMCDVNGKPLSTMQIDFVSTGSTGSVAIAQGYVVGSPSGGSFVLNYGTTSTASITWSTTPATAITNINNALTAASIPIQVTSGLGTPTVPFIFTWSSNGVRSTNLTCTPKFTGSSFSINSDFFLKDSELPALPTGQLATDTLPGLIISPRAEDTWAR